MTGLFDLPSRVMGLSIPGAGWFNKLLDAVRRRTIIAGPGIRADKTPNGTVISFSGVVSRSGGGKRAKETVKPFELRVVDGEIQIYIPSVPPLHKIGVANSSVELSPVIVNEQCEDEGWYLAGSLDNAVSRSTVNFKVCCNLVGSQDINPTDFYYQIGLNGYYTSVTQEMYKEVSLTTLYTVEVGDVFAETNDDDEVVLTGIAQYIVGNPVFDAGALFMDATKLTMRIDVGAGNNNTVYGEITQLNQRVTQLENTAGGGGGGGGADLSDDLPIADSEGGSAGSADGASRADHSHPLNADETVPSKIEANLQGVAGSSSKYARADHVHEFAAVSTGDEATELLAPDGGWDGEGANGGVEKSAAAVDHAHPLNVDEEGTDVGAAIISRASEDTDEIDYAGTSAYYARADHTHPIHDVAPLGCDGGEYANTDASKLKADGEDAQSGSKGGSVGNDGSGDDPMIAAPIAHSHPLNVRDATGDPPEDIDLEASNGDARHYARADHKHKLPNDGNDSTGVGTDTAPTGKTSILDDTDASNYGDGYSQTWTRRTDNDNGFTVPIMVALKYVGNTPTVFFRNLKVDRYGMVRGISNVTYGRKIVI